MTNRTTNMTNRRKIVIDKCTAVAYAFAAAENLVNYLSTRASAEGQIHDHSVTGRFLLRVFQDGHRKIFGVTVDERGRILKDDGEPRPGFLKSILRRTLTKGQAFEAYVIFIASRDFKISRRIRTRVLAHAKVARATIPTALQVRHFVKPATHK